MQTYLQDLYPDCAATVTTSWRRYQLEYTWRTTCQETYEPFETITRKALAHALADNSEDVKQQEIDNIMAKYESLDLYPPKTNLKLIKVPGRRKDIKKVTSRREIRINHVLEWFACHSSKCPEDPSCFGSGLSVG
jgi:hypothetical protein